MTFSTEWIYRVIDGVVEGREFVTVANALFQTSPSLLGVAGRGSTAKRTLVYFEVKNKYKRYHGPGRRLLAYLLYYMPMVSPAVHKYSSLRSTAHRAATGC